MSPRTHLTASLLAVSTLLAQGQPVLVKDIQTNLPPSYDYGRIVAGVLDGARTYFVSDDGGTKIRLWRTDGTTPGTTIVQEIDGTYGPVGEAEMVVRNGLVFFNAPSVAEGDELWRSDGTAAGTFVLPINAGSASAAPRNLVVHDQTAATAVYFSATKPSTGRELCRSDGTVAGTVTVVDVFPGTGSSMSSADPIAIAQATINSVVTPVVYFAAADVSRGKELWHYATSATLVADINPGVNGSGPRDFASHNGYLMFTALGPVGHEPYFVQNTGALSVVDIRAGVAGSSPGNVVAMPVRTGAVFCFSANDGVNGSELWGRTSSGLLERFDFVPGAGSSSPVPTPMGPAAALVIAGASTARRLYHLSLSTQAITLLPTPNSEPLRVYGPLLDAPLRALVTAQAGNPLTDSNLFVTDGTVGGTVGYGPAIVNSLGSALPPMASLPGLDRALLANGRVTNGVPASDSFLLPGLGVTGDAAPASFAEITPGTIVFTAADQTTTDRRLYRSDGTAAGTYLLADVRPITNYSLLLAWEGPFSPLYQGKRFFAGVAGGQAELWATDGTTGGTALVADLIPGPTSSYPGPYAVCGNTLVFLTYDGVNRTLWRSDGTAAGSSPLRSFPLTASLLQLPLALTVVNGVAYFPINDTSSGLELWRTDGTVAGTSLVKDINPGASHGVSNGQITPLPADPAQFVFFADDGVHGEELWKSGGTSATTQMVKDIRPGAASAGVRILGSNGTRLFLAANDGVLGEEPWSTDGTAANTVLLSDVYPGSTSSSPYPTGALGSTLFFFASSATARGLWRSGGTALTTSLLREFDGVSAINVWGTGAAIAGKFVFSAEEGAALGFRPWVTDGTVAGTTLLAAVTTGTANGQRSFFTIPGASKALFVGNLSPHGAELWVTDSTPAATAMHAQIRPFFPSSSPSGFFLSGNQIYFVATDGLLGRELYAMTAMAGAMAYGAGCRGTLGAVPSIAAANPPTLGASFDLRLGDARPLSPVALYVGFAPDELRLGGGCSLLWSLAAPSLSLPGASDGRGAATLSVPIPHDLNLEGLQLYCQYVVIDPAGAFANLAAFSNGVRAIIGRP